jgi:hypothetical protein
MRLRNLVQCELSTSPQQFRPRPTRLSFLLSSSYILFRHHVSSSATVNCALRTPPKRCASEAIPQHSSARTKVKKLEKLCGTNWRRRNGYILLQHHGCLRGRAQAYVQILFRKGSLALLWLTTTAEPVQALPDTETESEHLPTIESISAERQQRKLVQAQLDAQKEAQSQRGTPPADGAEGGIEGLEAEADQQGAFNPETGEINWDCPCLGGMATGPCGEQFKAAFSCFVYSEEEPKGMDCIDKFK